MATFLEAHLVLNILAPLEMLSVASIENYGILGELGRDFDSTLYELTKKHESFQEFHLKDEIFQSHIEDLMTANPIPKSYHPGVLFEDDFPLFGKEVYESYCLRTGKSVKELLTELLADKNGYEYDFCDGTYETNRVPEQFHCLTSGNYAGKFLLHSFDILDLGKIVFDYNIPNIQLSFVSRCREDARKYEKNPLFGGIYYDMH